MDAVSCPTLIQQAGSRNLSARMYWRKALGDSGNPVSVKMVGNAIANHCFGDGTGAHPSVRQIAAEASVSERTVARAITVLVNNYWITVKSGGGRRTGRRGSTFRGLANEYELVLHVDGKEYGTRPAPNTLPMTTLTLPMATDTLPIGPRIHLLRWQTRL